MHFSKKGSVIIAMMFAIVLSITAVSFFFAIGGRTTLVANQLKRAQAINCAEAALYETFNRIRAGATPASGTIINIPAVDPLSTSTPPATYNVPVTIIITDPAPAGPPYTIDAEVDYSTIRM